MSETEENVVTIKISVVRLEKTLTEKEWAKGGADGPEDSEYGYTPQVVKVQKIERSLLTMQVKKADLPAITKAILDNSTPLLEIS